MYVLCMQLHIATFLQHFFPMYICTVMSLAVGLGRLQSARNLGVHLILFQTGGQIMPTTLLLAPLPRFENLSTPLLCAPQVRHPQKTNIDQITLELPLMKHSFLYIYSVLKVSKSRKQIILFSILPKNEQKTSILGSFRRFLEFLVQFRILINKRKTLSISQ